MRCNVPFAFAFFFIIVLVSFLSHGHGAPFFPLRPSFQVLVFSFGFSSFHILFIIGCDVIELLLPFLDRNLSFFYLWFPSVTHHLFSSLSCLIGFSIFFFYVFISAAAVAVVFVSYFFPLLSLPAQPSFRPCLPKKKAEGKETPSLKIEEEES